MIELASFDTRDGLYDCAWSEDNEFIIAGCSGDGSVKIWDCSTGGPPRDTRYPIRSYGEHRSEVYSIDWNPVNKKTFITGYAI